MATGCGRRASAAPAAAARPAGACVLRLELGLPAGSAQRLLQLKIVVGWRTGRIRTQPWRTIWHDTADLALTRRGLALTEQRGVWRLEPLWPDADGRRLDWPPGAPAPFLAQAADPATLDVQLPVRPVASCAGRLRTLALRVGETDMSLAVLEAEARGVTSATPCARAWLECEDDQACLDAALMLAAQSPLAIPRDSLSAEVLAAATGTPARPRRLGAPSMPAGSDPAAAFAHVVGHLTDVILHWSGLARPGQDPEPVHQMRVGLRRLRAALSAFRRAVDSPPVQAVASSARNLARLLGPARDWDVFVTETGASVARAFPDDAPVSKLLASAARRRDGAYEPLRAFLDGPEFRAFGIRLAALAGSRFWHAALSDEQRDMLASDLPAFAGRVMDRRLRRVVEAGENIAELDAAALHRVRLDGKRLRYAAEIFAPLFGAKPVKRFLRRLADLQEDLGKLNDSAVTGHLMAELAGERAGAERAYAAGVVRGFVAAGAAEGRADIARVWDRFLRVKPFW
ncbi:MAG: CHAD domain-containing protein [Proteobacteria bacterium]|nr:CHAD domain-containing protein [Pseudomonadota bacterium]